MKILDFEQNTEEWFDAKRGRSSSSRVKNVLVDKYIPKTDIINHLVEQYKTQLDEEYKDEVFKDLDAKEVEKGKKTQLAEYKKSLSIMSQRELESMVPQEMFEEAFTEAQKKEYYRLMAEQLGYFDDAEEDDRARGHRLEPQAAEAFAEKTGLKLEEVGICIRDDEPNISLSPDRLIKKGKKYVAGLEIKSPGVVNHLEIWKTQRIPKEYFWQVIQYFVVVDDMKKMYFVSYNPIVVECPLIILEVDRKDMTGYIRRSLEDQKTILNHIKKDIEKLTF